MKRNRTTTEAELREQLLELGQSTSDERMTLWRRTMFELERSEGASDQPRRPARHAFRIVLIAASALIVFSGVAVATGVISSPFDSDTPAGRVGAFNDGRAIAVAPAPSALADRGRDEVPAFALQEMRASIASVPDRFPDDVQPGDLVEDRARVLLEVQDPRGQGIALYAAPTSNGQVCFVAIGRGTSGSGCLGDFTTAEPVHYIVNGSDAHGYGIVGLVADEVTRVDITLADGATTAASMGRNAFAWQGALAAPVAPVLVTAHLADGTTREFAIAAREPDRT